MMANWSRNSRSFKQSARLMLLCTMLAGLCAACRTVAPLPEADLTEPEWTVQQGQAVWRASAGAPEIAGEILVASHVDGMSLVQFSKNPFALVTARSTPWSWEIRLPTKNRRYSGRGKPPARIFWLLLPQLLSGGLPPVEWHWQAAADNSWKLENRRTGELLEGFFVQ